MRNIAPSLSDRALLVGMTGSGKTTLAKVLLEPRPYVVIYDAKGTLNWRGYERHTMLETLVKVDAEKSPKLIYAPNHRELNDKKAIHSFFHWIYERRNTTVYVDEVYAVTNNNEIPEYYHAILTRGREMNISAISSTQRPKQIPQAILSESECYYVFRLLLPQDRQKIREILPVSDEQLMGLGKHCFLFGSSDGGILGPLKLGRSKGRS